MYICKECLSVFAQPDESFVPIDDTGRTFRLATCPYCMSDEIYLTVQCANCGDWASGEYITTAHGDVLCDRCYTTHEVGEY